MHRAKKAILYPQAFNLNRKIEEIRNKVAEIIIVINGKAGIELYCSFVKSTNIGSEAAKQTTATRT